MAKQCIRCKREIAKGQKECYVCGSSQNKVIHYFGGGVFVLVLMVTAAAVSYWFISKANAQLNANIDQLANAKQQLSEAEDIANQALEQVKQIKLDTETKSAAQQATLESQSNAQADAKIAEADKRATDAQKNVNWLSKQNKQLKNDVQQLTEQLAAQQGQSTNSLSEAQVSARIEAAGQADKAQIETLSAEVESLKLQLEALQITDNN